MGATASPDQWLTLTCSCCTRGWPVPETTDRWLRTVEARWKGELAGTRLSDLS